MKIFIVIATILLETVFIAVEAYGMAAMVVIIGVAMLGFTNYHQKKIKEETDTFFQQLDVSQKEFTVAAEKYEKQQIAEKLKKKERRRKLETQVRQELIKKGELMPAAGRAPIPRDIVDAVYTRDGGRCVYCGSNENLQIDHIIPFSKGGADTLENFQILCQKCNIEKSNKIG